MDQRGNFKDERKLKRMFADGEKKGNFGVILVIEYVSVGNCRFGELQVRC
jgi:hypothetical protein